MTTRAVSPGTELPPPRHGGRPRDPSRDEAIRAALLRLLGEVGYGGLTMDALAQAAGVGKATIYRRWRTKQDLIVDSVSDLGSVLTVPPDTGSLREDLHQFMHLVAEITRSPVGAMLQSAVGDAPLSRASRRLPRGTADSVAERRCADVGPGRGPRVSPCSLTPAIRG
jgi:AcrR family transcriptional regulator